VAVYKKIQKRRMNMETKCYGNAVFEYDDKGKIISISVPGFWRVGLGDTVTANGRTFEPDGLKGIVKEIYFPFTDCRSSDVIDVLFENGRLHSMKAKDLRL
jgi:hypothetical protein